MVSENYNFILNQIRSIRPKDTPILIAVSKKQPPTKIQEALNGGLRCFGENQLKEGIEKFSEQKDIFPDLEIHHIGPVQTGSLRKLFGIYSYTHGVGTENALKELVKQSEQRKYKMNYFLQVNLTNENTKSGFERETLLNLLNTISTYQSEFANFFGLMTMGPSNGDPIITRKVFRELAQIRLDYTEKANLSMGMSGDYLIAAQEGSNYIRVGSAIFGDRILK